MGVQCFGTDTSGLRGQEEEEKPSNDTEKACPGREKEKQEGTGYWKPREESVSEEEV